MRKIPSKQNFKFPFYYKNGSETIQIIIWPISLHQINSNNNKLIPHHFPKAKFQF